MQVKDLIAQLETMNPNNEIRMTVNTQSIDYSHIRVKDNNTKTFIEVFMPITQTIQIILK